MFLICSKETCIFFAYKKLKKPPSKVAQNNSNPLFFLTAWAAQMAQTEEFVLQNVAYRPTVYRTGYDIWQVYLHVQWNLDLRKPVLRKNLDLRKIVGTTDFLVYNLRKISLGLMFDLRKIFFQKVEK